MDDRTSAGYRIEHDLLGDRPVAAEALWGVHTTRAIENFPIARRPAHPELVRAMGVVKEAAARTNHRLGLLGPQITGAIVAAAGEVASGKLDDAIVVDALQGGAGTSLNMNVNEVIANRAEEMLGGRRGFYARIHPIDHVNLHQSTNDVFPTALRIAALRLLKRLESAIADLQTAFQEKERVYSGVVKIARTELQDACPVSFGAVFSAFAEALSRDRWRVFKCEERLRVVNLGGTAIGTGITAPRDYVFQVVETLRSLTGLGLARAENLVDATQNADPFVEVSGILKAHATNLFKISSDLRLLSSGPQGGFGEIRLPAVQAGSSIMPGKVNPVIPEAVGQAAMRVIGHDAVITLAAQNGQMELNAFLPLLADSLLDALDLLVNACTVFRTRCVEGLEVNVEACGAKVRASRAVVTALLPRLGYALATEVAEEATRRDTSVVAVVLERGLVPVAELDGLLSANAQTALGHR